MLRSVQLRKGLMFLLGLALLVIFTSGNAYAASADEKLVELQQRVNGLESLVKDLSISVMTAAKSLEVQATGLTPRIFNLENMIKDLSFDVKKTVAALSDMRGNVDALIAEVEEFQPLVIALQSTVVKFGDKLEYISNDIDKLTVGLANVSEQANQTDAHVTVFAGQIATLNDEFVELYSATSALKATVEINSGQIGELNVKVRSNGERIYENGAAIETLAGFAAEAQDSIHAAVSELSIAAGTIDGRTSRLERAVDELSILGPTLASLRNTVAGLAARSDRVDARLGRLEDFAEQFAGASENLSIVTSATQGLSSRLSMVEQMVGEIKSSTDIESIRAQIERLKGSMGGTPANVQRQLDSLNSAVSKIGQLLIELESTKLRVNELAELVSSSQSGSVIDEKSITTIIQTEITKEIIKISEKSDQIDEALKKANAANGLALLALLAGVAAIALNLLL